MDSTIPRLKLNVEQRTAKPPVKREKADGTGTAEINPYRHVCTCRIDSQKGAAVGLARALITDILVYGPTNRIWDPANCRRWSRLFLWSHRVYWKLRASLERIDEHHGIDFDRSSEPDDGTRGEWGSRFFFGKSHHAQVDFFSWTLGVRVSPLSPPTLDI